jgi:TldD protein
MKRREFMERSSLTLAAAATSSAWLTSLFEGTASAKEIPIFETFFGVGKAEMEKLLGVCLSRGADFADLFFEHRINSNLFFEEDTVKNASRGIVQGVGVRVVKGDQVGFAFSEDLSMESLTAAARTAAAIANDQNAKVRAQAIGMIKPKNLYPIQELASETELGKKLTFIEQANKSAKAASPKITKVTVSFNDEMKYIAYANSEGLSWTDAQPMFMFQTSCIAEQGSDRQVGYDGGGGRVGLEYFAKHRSPSDIATYAAQQAVTNLEAREIEAGPMEVVLGPSDSGVLLHEAVGHGLEADFNRKKLSNYSDRVGQRVASDLCTVVDEGLFENMRGTINLDDEGNAPTSAVLIEDGILRGYMHDRISAKQMSAKATGNGRRQAYNYAPMPRMTNTYMRPGKEAPEDIIKSVKRGIYAKKFGGGQVDITKGDFTFTVQESYLIEDGKITAPLKGVTLIGNGPDVMTKVVAVGNDLKFTDGGWTCGKNGQSVPVGMGIPTVKVSEITVGGTKVRQPAKA